METGKVVDGRNACSHAAGVSAQRHGSNVLWPAIFCHLDCASGWVCFGDFDWDHVREQSADRTLLHNCAGSYHCDSIGTMVYREPELETYNQ